MHNVRLELREKLKLSVLAVCLSEERTSDRLMAGMGDVEVEVGGGETELEDLRMFSGLHVSMFQQCNDRFQAEWTSRKGRGDFFF